MGKNKLKFGLALAALLLVGGITEASAQYGQRRPPNPRSVNQRQVHQQTRIYNGVNKGSVSGSEYKRLQQQQFRIDSREARMRQSGGVFTGRERARVQASQTNASRNIYRAKHNRIN